MARKGKRERPRRRDDGAGRGRGGGRADSGALGPRNSIGRDDLVHEAYIVRPDAAWAELLGRPPRELLAISWTPGGKGDAIGFVRILAHNPAARSLFDPDHRDTKHFLELGPAPAQSVRDAMAEVVEGFRQRNGNPMVHRLEINGGFGELEAKLRSVPYLGIQKRKED